MASLSRVVDVTLRASTGQFTAGMAAAARSVQDMEKAAARAGNSASGAGKGIDGLGKSASGVSSGMAGAARSMDQLEQSADRSKQTFSNLGGLMAVAGVSIGAALAASVKSAMDFDSAMSSVGAATHASASDLDQLKTAAMNAGAEFGQFTSTDAAGAIEELGKAGLSTSEIIGGGLHGAMALAASDGMAVADAAQITAQAMSEFGLKGTEATHVADLLTQGAGAAVGSAKDLGEGLGNAGTAAHGFGMTLQDTVTTLAVFAQNGLKGAEGGTVLKSMLLALANPSKQASQAMADLGLKTTDAEGKFVGMRSIMDQLNKATAGMTAGQKEAALATIFGTHAVLAGNIAAQEGSKGYDQMAQKMAAFGTAADQAAARNNNLAGDFKNLQGSAENLGIKIGEMANGPLRTVAQGLTAMFDAAQRHTTATAGLLIFAGSLTAVGVAAMGVVKVVKAMQEMSAAVSAAKGVMASWATAQEGGISKAEQAGSTFGKVSGALAKVGLAYGAVQLAGAAVDAMWGHQATSGEVLTTQLEGMAKGSEDAKKSLDADFHMSKWMDFTGQINGLSGAFQALKGNSNFFNESLTSIGGALGITTQLSALRQQFEAVDKSLTGMNAAQATSAFQQIATEAKNAGVGVDDLVKVFPQYAAQMTAAAGKAGVFNLSNQQIVDMMQGKLPAAMQAAASATGVAGQASATLAQQQAALKQATDEVTQAVRAQATAQIAASGGMIGLEAAIAQAADSQKKYGANLNITTEAGRQNRTALDGIASAALQAATSMEKAGASSSQIAAEQQRGYSAFVKSAEAMGMSAAAAKALATQYGLIPPSKTTTITAKGAAASEAQVAAFVASLKGVPAEKKAILTSIAKTDGIEVAKKALAAIPANKDTKLTAQNSGAPVIAAFAASIKSLPAQQQAILLAIAKLEGVDTAKAAIASVTGKSVTVGTKADLKGQQTTQAGINSTTGKVVTVGTKPDLSGQQKTQAGVNSTTGKTVTVSTTAALGPVYTAKATIDSLHDRTVYITTVMRTIGAGAMAGGAAAAGVSNADGNILKFYANGGMENHVAQIAPAGAWRVWAEEETGGEAYIPLAPTKRGRSMAILEQVAAMFGRKVEPYANGGTTVDTSAVWRQMQTVIGPLQQLATNMTAAAQSAKALADANKAVAKPVATKAKADAAYTQAVSAKNALNARQVNEDLYYKQAILNAQGKSDTAKIAQLTAAKERANLDYRAKILAAERDHSTKQAAALKAQQKAADLSYDKQIQAAKGTGKVNQAAVTRLEAARKQNDINQARQMAAANAKVTAAQKAKTAADAAAAAILERAKTAAEAAKTAQQALMETQKQMADQANSASTSLQQGYQSGDTLAEWMANQHQGALQLATLNADIFQLQKAGASKNVLDQLLARGGSGVGIADQLLAGGKTAIDAANKAAATLDKFGDAVGWRQTTGNTLAGSVNTQELAQLRAQIVADQRASNPLVSDQIKQLATLIAQFRPVPIYTNDPLAAALAVKRVQTDALNKVGVR